MADRYTIVTEEGAQRYGAEVGSAVDLEIDDGERLAVIAAGWIRPGGTKKEAKD